MDTNTFFGTNAGERLLASGMNPAVLRPWVEPDGKAYINLNGVAVPVTNATLRKDEWIQLDQAIVREARSRLVGVNYIMGKGLVYNLNGMAKTVLEHETMNDMTAAVMSMDGLSAQDRDATNFELAGLPLPITHKDFQLSSRVLNTSRNGGSALDVTRGEQAARQVAEKIETTFFAGGSSFKTGGYTLYGMLDHPSRNTGSLTAHWNDSAATGETILADVLRMKQALLDDGFYGPYALFVPSNFETGIDEDFKANSDKSIRQRLLEVSGIQDIIVADKLTDDYVCLVQLTQDVVRIVNGLAINTLQWDSSGGLQLNFKVMAIQVPQFRATQAGAMGLAVFT